MTMGGLDGLSGGFEVVGSFYDPAEKTSLRGGVVERTGSLRLSV